MIALRGEVRRQRTEVRSQRTEVRSQKTVFLDTNWHESARIFLDRITGFF